MFEGLLLGGMKSWAEIDRDRLITLSDKVGSMGKIGLHI